jgi:hypothetical protein
VLVPGAMKKTKKLSLTTTTLRKLADGDYVRVAGGRDDEPIKSAVTCPSVDLATCFSCSCVTCAVSCTCGPSGRLC